MAEEKHYRVLASQEGPELTGVKFPCGVVWLNKGEEQSNNNKSHRFRAGEAEFEIIYGGTEKFVKIKGQPEETSWLYQILEKAMGRLQEV